MGALIFMPEIGLYKNVHDQVLDYVDEDIIGRSARWGLGIQKTLEQNKRFVVQMGAEEGSVFMYAIATAVIVGEFGKSVHNDHFSDEAGIDLDLLSMDFQQIEGFLEKDIAKDRRDFLDGGNSISLQDIWSTVDEWKADIHKSLTHIFGTEKVDEILFRSLSEIFENAPATDTQRLSAYTYISNGFQI